jgi:predicted MPP superfamily phosphohydrolase
MMLAVWAQVYLALWLVKTGWARRSPVARRLVLAAAFVLTAWVVFGFLANLPRAYSKLPYSWTLSWARGGAMAWAIPSVGVALLLMLWRRTPQFNAGRRNLFRLAGNAAVAAPIAVMGFGILGRHNFRLKEVDVPVLGLPKDLDGLRLVQISDIHLSPYLSESELARAVDMANEQRAHIALVTGDLISTKGDPLDACLRQLARLRADAGVLGCLGNHEVYAQCEDETAWKGAALGVQFLRKQARALRFGDATLNVVGVDYQRMDAKRLTGVDKLVVPGATNVLLSHNPNAFDTAALLGYSLTIAGHTHGGQIAVEILDQTLSPVRFSTPYIYGLFRKERSALWVTRGLGTVAVPARIGAPPEVAVIRLCAI